MSEVGFESSLLRLTSLALNSVVAGGMLWVSFVSTRSLTKALQVEGKLALGMFKVW